MDDYDQSDGHAIEAAELRRMAEDEFLTVKISKKDAELALTDHYGEGLGKDYLKKPFRKPSQRLAREFALAGKFKNGQGSVFGTTIEELGELGPGVALYFKTVHLLACTFTCMSLVYVPTFMVFTNGGAINPENIDAFKFLTTSIANMPNVNVTQANDFFSLGSSKLKYKNTLTMLCACDFAALVIFFIAFCLLVRLVSLTEGNLAKEITASSYSIYVTKLPPDATEEEIRAHFSCLYDLDKPVPMQRKPFMQLFRGLTESRSDHQNTHAPRAESPVGSTIREAPASLGTQNSPDMTSGSDIASASPTRLRRVFFAEQKLSTSSDDHQITNAESKVPVNQALPVTYTASGSQSEFTLSPFASTLGASFDTPKAQSSPNHGEDRGISTTNPLFDDELEEDETNDLVADPAELYPNVSITPRFNTSIAQLATQGQLRAMSASRQQSRANLNEHADSATPSMTFLELIRPKPVLDTTFCGHQRYLNSWVAEVSIAKPIGDRMRFYLFTHQLNVKLMQARAKAKYYAFKLKKRVTRNQNADTQGSELSGQGVELSSPSPNSNASSDVEAQTPSRVRFQSADQIRGSTENSNRPVFNRELSFGRILVSPSNSIAQLQQMLRNAQDEVDQLDRTIHDVADGWRRRWKCIKFMKDMTALVEEKKKLDSCAGAFVIFNNRKSQQLCLDEYAGSTMLIGRLLQKNALRFRETVALRVQEAPEPSDLKWENLDVPEWNKFLRNTAVDAVAMGILALAMFTTYSIFGGQQVTTNSFINPSSGQDDQVSKNIGLYSQVPTNVATAIVLFTGITLRVSLRWLEIFTRPYTHTEAENDVTEKLFISQVMANGVVQYFAVLADLIHTGFTRVVYVYGGIQVLFSQLGMVVLPHALRLFKFLIFNPARKYWMISRHQVYTQDQMNRLFQGEPFTLSSRYPDVLTAVTIALAFSPGLPLLVVITAAQLWLSLWVDRWLIVAYHRKPVRYSVQSCASILSRLPYAMLLHLIGGIFMFGNPYILRPNVYSEAITRGEFLRLSLLNQSPYISSSEQLSIYAICCAAVTIIAFCIGGWKQIHRSRLIQELMRWFGRGKALIMDFFDENMKFPQYTSTFYRFLDERRQLTLDQWFAELKKGYVIHENGLVFRTWTSDGTEHGVKHSEGTLLTTWESIGDSSYRIFANKNYQYVMLTLTNHMSRSLKRLEDDFTTIMQTQQEGMDSHVEIGSALRVEAVENPHPPQVAEAPQSGQQNRHFSRSSTTESDIDSRYQKSHKRQQSSQSSLFSGVNRKVLDEKLDTHQLTSEMPHLDHLVDNRTPNHLSWEERFASRRRSSSITQEASVATRTESYDLQTAPPRRSSPSDLTLHINRRLVNVAEVRRLSRGGSRGDNDVSPMRRSSGTDMPSMRRSSGPDVPSMRRSSGYNNEGELRSSPRTSPRDSMLDGQRTVLTHPDWEFVIENEHVDHYASDPEMRRSSIYQHDLDPNELAASQRARRDSRDSRKDSREGYTSDRSSNRRASASPSISPRGVFI